jgi:hypothetical protein
MYGPSDIQGAIDLLYLYEEMVQQGGVNRNKEVRQMRDGLGLSEKGKRDLRWRVSDAAPAVPAKRKPAERVKGLRAV